MSLSKLALTVSTWDYDRVRPLLDGRVQVEGCDVTYIPLPPEECFRRAWLSHDFAVSELGFSSYLLALARGVSPYVGLPLFTSRMFRHSAIYVRTDRGIDAPSDLRGKVIGVPEYQMAAATWVRGMLQDHYGVPPAAIRWMQGGQESPGRGSKFPLHLPADVRLDSIGERETLNELLAEGQLDGFVGSRIPSCYRDGKTPLRRLFEDFPAAEQAYYRATHIFPIMHLIGIRRDVYQAHPWLANSLYKAFNDAKRIAQADLRETAALKVMLPWLTSALEETIQHLGEDYWAYGLEENRAPLEAITRYSYEQGLSERRLDVDELFAPITSEAVI